MGDPTLREFLEERIRELTRRIDALTVAIDAMAKASEGYLTRTAYEVGHETLRVEVSATRSALAELKTLHVADDSTVRGQIATLRARFAGAAAALSLAVAIVIALLTILEIGGR